MAETTNITDSQVIEQKESIKLIKNTKGYQFEIKIHIPKVEDMSNQSTADEIAVKRLEVLNLMLRDKFPSEEVKFT